jgi:hypothetical protein
MGAERIEVARLPFQVSHVTFEIGDHPDTGLTFTLTVSDAPAKKDRGPLFTGFVHQGMPEQLRALADHLQEKLEGGEV